MAASSIPFSALGSLGDLLKFLRRRARLSQRELSIAVGYSESHVSRIENNERPLDRATLLALFVPALQVQQEPETIAHLLRLLPQVEATADITYQDTPTPAPGFAHLPIPLTSFVGRQTEVTELCQLLADRHTRLLTLTGAGGCGKTRLALQVARQIAQAYEHGVWLAELASLSTPQQLLEAIAALFDLRASADRPLLATLSNFLYPRQALLLLDNCEHLVEAVAHLAATLLRICPQLQILATSRESLPVPGEVNYLVLPLALPPMRLGERPTRSEVEGYDAIRLFVARAAATWRSFTLNDQNAPAIAVICQRLDGIPLGIELAAAWTPLLSPEQIATRLERSIDLPPGGYRLTLSHHQTLRAAIQWSIDLLAPEEQILLRRLSVFSGGWSLEAIEEVAGGLPPLTEEEVLGVLQRLVQKSLVVVTHSANGDVRYHFLETIREFTRRQLAESEEELALQDRHLAWHVTLAEKAEPRLKGPQQLYWLDVLDNEHENMRAALAYALSRPRPEEGLRLVGALGHYWWMRNLLVEGSRWCEAAVSAVAADSHLALSAHRAKALFVSGMFAHLQFELQGAQRQLEESLHIFRKNGDMAGAGATLCFAALVQDGLQNSQQAIHLFQEAIACSQRAEDTWWIAEHLH